MRKFYIENELGTRIPLNGENGVWFSSPTGLGQADNIATSTGPAGFFSVTQRNQKQMNIVGELVFVRDVYAAFQAFANFVNTAEKLVLVYDPNGTEYKRNVICAYLTKTEKTKGGWLRVPSSWAAMTPWFTEQSNELVDGSATFNCGNQLGCDFALDLNLVGASGLSVSINGNVVTHIGLDNFTGNVSINGGFTGFGFYNKATGEDMINLVDLSANVLPALFKGNNINVSVYAESGSIAGDCKIHEYSRSV